MVLHRQAASLEGFGENVIEENDQFCIDPWQDYVEEFGFQKGLSWHSIEQGVTSASELRSELCATLSDLTSNDYDVVVFGSLARGEWTTGSDVDWTLLLDGQASSDHRLIHHQIRDRLQEFKFRGKKLVDPGREGVFGNMAFSHEIIHHIGGQSDTNRNTTQRILLLLEAASISETCDTESGPFDRVVREILLRYLRDDTICLRPPTDQSRIPRFLLNDIVRFWRTTGSAHTKVLCAQGLVSGTVRSTRTFASCQPGYSYRGTASAMKV
jgi:predicted nucleotidyltransferase